MPTYQYACTECGDRTEVVQKFTDDALTVCSACDGKLRKVFSPVGIVFKGSGFYRTDSRNGSSSAEPAKNGDKSRNGSSDSSASSGSGSSGEGSSGEGSSGSKSESGSGSGNSGGSGSSGGSGGSGSPGGDKAGSSSSKTSSGSSAGSKVA